MRVLIDRDVKPSGRVLRLCPEKLDGGCSWKCERQAICTIPQHYILLVLCFHTTPQIDTSSLLSGTIDNMIMMRAVIYNNRRLNRKSYCYFADAYKCFDKLWLKDCLVELWRAGMREREVYMLYEMNKESHIVIETPV